MPMYIVAVSDFHDKTNVNMVIWAKDKIDAVVAAAGRKNKAIKKIEDKILDTYSTVAQLQKYFAGYWSFGLSEPVEHADVE